MAVMGVITISCDTVIRLILVLTNNKIYMDPTMNIIRCLHLVFARIRTDSEIGRANILKHSITISILDKIAGDLTGIKWAMEESKCVLKDITI